MIDILWSKRSNRERFLIFLLSLIMFYLIAICLIVNPIVIEWDRVNKDLEMYENKLQYDRMLVDMKDTFQREYDIFRKEKRNIRGSVDDEWLLAIKNAAGNEVFIESLSPGTTREYKFYNLRNAEIRCKGELTGIIKFIYNIVHSPYLLSVESLRLQTSRENTKKIDCSITIAKLTLTGNGAMGGAE